MNCHTNLTVYKRVAEDLAQGDGVKRHVVRTEKCYDIITKYDVTRFKIIYTTKNGE